MDKFEKYKFLQILIRQKQRNKGNVIRKLKKSFFEKDPIKKLVKVNLKVIKKRNDSLYFSKKRLRK